MKEVIMYSDMWHEGVISFSSRKLNQLQFCNGPALASQLYSCSREHNPAIFMLPGAQSSSTCDPGSTNGICQLACAKHRWARLCTTCRSSLVHTMAHHVGARLCTPKQRCAHHRLCTTSQLASSPKFCVRVSFGVQDSIERRRIHVGGGYMRKEDACVRVQDSIEHMHTLGTH